MPLPLSSLFLGPVAGFLISVKYPGIYDEDKPHP